MAPHALDGDPDLRFKVTITASMPTTEPSPFPDLFNGYTAPTPPGYVYEDLRPLCMGVLWTMVALGTLAVVGRLYTRYRITRIVGLEDWLMPVSLAALIGVTAIQQDLMTRGFLGLHLWDIKLHMPTVMDTVTFVIGQSLYHISTGCTRLAIILFVKRLNPYTLFAYFITANIAVNIFFPIFAICSLVFRCSPVSAGFDPILVQGPGVSCIDSVKYGKAVMSLSLALDIITWMLPVILVLRAPADWRKKVVMASILSLGMLACIASAFRIPATFQIWRSHDLFWDNVKLTVFMHLEMGIGIIAACGAGLKPLFELAWNRVQVVFGGAKMKSRRSSDGGKLSEDSNVVMTMESNPQVIPQSTTRKTFGSTECLYMEEVDPEGYHVR